MGKKLHRSIVLLVIICLLVGSMAVLAQGKTPPDPFMPPSASFALIAPFNHSRDQFDQDKDAFNMKQGFAQFKMDANTLEPLATGGPDGYGYTWDDSLAISWINAHNLGTKSTLVGDDEFTGPIDIGFTFPFYENNYNQLYFNTNGLVTFGQGSPSYSYTVLPNDTKPNNLVAPFWSDLAVYASPSRPDSGIYTFQGGASPNRYFVIEWYRVEAAFDFVSWDLTFEVVLYENGDLLFQYLTLSGSLLRLSTAGIEDDQGLAGLKYSGTFPNPTSNKAIYFSRPAAAARVKAWPLHQGQFANAAESIDFPINVRNNGSLGDDIFDFSTYSTWPVSYYRQDGTLLTDSDGDYMVDTGSLSPGATLGIIARMQAPTIVNLGDSNTTQVTIRSSLDTNKTKYVYLTASVPGSFAQVFRESLDNALSLYTVSPQRQALKKVTPDNYSTMDMAVVETPERNLVTAWSVRRCLDPQCDTEVQEIEYSVVDHYGATVKPLTRLVDHSGATLSTYDYDLAIAAAPDGRIGVLWVRELYNYSTGEFYDNIWFTILDSYGNLSHGPTNLTNNTTFQDWDTFPAAGLDSATITASGDNRFALVWRELIDYGPGVGDYVSDLFIAVRGSDNSLVRDETKFTSSNPYGPWYWEPNLSNLSDNRVLLVYQIDVPDTNPHPVVYAVFNSDGTTFKNQATLTEIQSPYCPDAVQLSNSSILVSWEGGSQIGYAILDGSSYNLSNGPIYLTNPATSSGDYCASVTADNNDHGILTWSDRDYSHNLYYAIVNGSGSQLVPPTILLSAHSGAGESQGIFSSSRGSGNTSFTEQPTYPGIDTYLQVSPWVGAPTNGVASIPVAFGNHGLTIANQVGITATLDLAMNYQGNTLDIPPNINGQVVSWHLPIGLGFMGLGKFQLLVGVPDAPVGTQYPLTLQISSTGVEANPSNNTADLMVTVSNQVFLPMTVR